MTKLNRTADDDPVASNALLCTYCNGNDADAPCAYPSENKPGCLRDARLRGQNPDNTPPSAYYDIG